MTKFNKAAKLVIAGSLTYHFVLKLASSKKPYKLVDKPERKIIVVGAGLTGLTTAYYLTNDPRNHVTVLEKAERICDESSSCTGNILMPYDSVPATSAKFVDII